VTMNGVRKSFPEEMYGIERKVKRKVTMTLFLQTFISQISMVTGMRMEMEHTVNLQMMLIYIRMYLWEGPLHGLLHRRKPL